MSFEVKKLTKLQEITNTEHSMIFGGYRNWCGCDCDIRGSATGCAAEYIDANAPLCWPKGCASWCCEEHAGMSYYTHHSGNNGAGRSTGTCVEWLREVAKWDADKIKRDAWDLPTMVSRFLGL